MVKPSFFSRAMVWPICWMMTGARPSVGSSSIRNAAPVRRIRAIASICCSPPDNLVPWLLSRSFRLGNRSKICSSDRPPGRTIGGNSRFSRTSRLAKIPRSSGQNATPMRAILSEDARVMSWPLKRIEPVRLPMIPITDLSVVVLPAPLRPSSVTTSPAFTLKSMPWRICDSPYQASRFCTDSTAALAPDAAVGLVAAAAIFKSGMTRPQIGFLDALVPGQIGIIAFRQHMTARQHRDDVGEIGDDAEVVFDHQDRVFRRDALDQGGDLVDVFVPHAGHRLVEQHHFRFERQRGRDFERALAPIGHLHRRRHRKLAEADIFEQFTGAAVEAVEHRQMRKYRRDLERTHQTEPRHVRRRQRSDILSLIENLAGRRLQKFRQKIETCGLAGPVRTDQRVNAATADPEIDIANREEPRELLAQSVGFENELIGQSNFPHQPDARERTQSRAWPIFPNRQMPWDALE